MHTEAYIHPFLMTVQPHALRTPLYRTNSPSLCMVASTDEHCPEWGAQPECSYNYQTRQAFCSLAISLRKAAHDVRDAKVLRCVHSAHPSFPSMNVQC